jgi:hypothetical protein
MHVALNQKMTDSKCKQRVDIKLNSGGFCGQELSAGLLFITLLYSLVVDELIEGLSENSCYIVGYETDIAVLISRKFLNTLSELLQESVGMVQQWCDITLDISQSTKDVASLIYKEERFKGPKGTNPVWP